MGKKKTGYEPVEHWEPGEEVAEEPEVKNEAVVEPDVIEIEPPYVPDPTAPQSYVKLELPQAALFALLDPSFPLSSVADAEYYGLLDAVALTPMGEKVLAGCDQRYLRHKLASGERAAHNAAIDAEMKFKADKLG